MFTKIRHLRTKTVRHGVTRIKILKESEINPKTCKDWIQIDVPTEIVEHLQNRNCQHFGQAHRTPFTVPPLSDTLGYRGDGIGTEQLLSGTYDLTAYEPHVQLLLAHLHRVEAIAKLPTRAAISEQEFVSKLKIWSEKTTTSPSGLHLGHYKAMIARHSFSSDAADEDRAA